MKKVCFPNCFFLFLLVIFIQGCGEKDLIEPTNPTNELSLILIATPETLGPEGGTSVINITAVADSTVSDLPGATFIAGSFTKSVETPILDKTTSFHFKSYLNGKMVYRYVSVYVTPLPKPTIVLTSSVDTLDIGGGEVTITIATTDADSVFSVFDGKMLLPNCSENYTIDTTTTFSYEAYGPGGTISKYITVFVEIAPPPLTLPQYLCKEPWGMVMLEFKSLEGNWSEATIMLCQLDNLLDFYQDGTFLHNFGVIKCSSNEPDSSIGRWGLDGNFIDFGDPGGFINEIVYISRDTLVWVYCFSDGSCTRETFVHP